MKPKPRKYFGKPSVLMVNAIIAATVKRLRRERRKLRKLLSEEYAALKELERKYPTEVQDLLTSIEAETERLRNEFMVEASRT